MKLIVITSADSFENEHQVLGRMLKHGLKYLHVRKPKYTREKMLRYLQKFPEEYRKRIIIHSHHSLALSLRLKGIHLTEKHRTENFNVWKKFKLYRLRHPKLQITTSFHKLKDLKDTKEKYDYVFLSPVFESITKEDYEPSYSLGTIYDALKETKKEVIALGGVDDKKIELCYETGFKGVALAGHLWQSDDPVVQFDQAKEICSQYKMQF